MKIICDWENCKEVGKYKAPKEKDNSKDFRLLCLEHIKIFNKNWNYFENMNSEEIEFFIKSDATWHKSTKSFSSSDNFFNILWNNACCCTEIESVITIHSVFCKIQFSFKFF